MPRAIYDSKVDYACITAAYPKKTNPVSSSRKDEGHGTEIGMLLRNLVFQVR
ncbi:MAG: hypothetical protein JXR53_11675 [Bacteroidales bacterium]|nr:hypothetical protein [Bacteroidales bacterium]